MFITLAAQVQISGRAGSWPVRGFLPVSVTFLFLICPQAQGQDGDQQALQCQADQNHQRPGGGGRHPVSAGGQRR